MYSACTVQSKYYFSEKLQQHRVRGKSKSISPAAGDEQVSFVWLVIKAESNMQGEEEDCSQDKVGSYHKIKYHDQFQNWFQNFLKFKSATMNANPLPFY